VKKIAIIPARGGSKRLPRKNVLPFMGKPMLTYPIKTALDSGLFDEVIVSTEDLEIASVAEDAGARILKRPFELAQDRASVKQVCLNVLDELKQEGVSIKYFCCLYATAVFVTEKDLQESFELMANSSENDVVMGVSGFNLQPLQALIEDNGFLKPQWPEYEGVQSQFHPKLVASNGTLYWVKASTFIKTKSFYGGNVVGYEMPWIRAIDIDTPGDFETAKMLGPIIWVKKC